MSVRAAAFPAALARALKGTSIVARPSPAQPARLAVLVHADIKEINTEDTVGVGSLLDRDFKQVPPSSPAPLLLLSHPSSSSLPGSWS
jgi:hypothetical protein